MKGYVINLDSRKDRWFYCDTQLQKFHLKHMKRFSAIRHEKGFVGCTLSHLAVLQTLLLQEQNDKWDETYLILEDDFFITTNLNDALVPIIMNHQWDVFCLSRTREKLESDPKFSPYFKIQKCHSSCAYLLKRYMLPIFIDCFTNALHHDEHIDVEWQTLQTQYTFLTTKEPIIKQLNVYSNLVNDIMTYQSQPYMVLKPKGRLGNLLFQLAFCLQKAFDFYKFIYIIPSHEWKSYTIFNRFDEFHGDDDLQTTLNPIHYDRIPYHSFSFHSNQSYIIDGYFQSYRYFDNILPEGPKLFDLLDIPDDIYKQAHQLMQKLKGEIIMIHVRRSDYLHKENQDLFVDLCSTDYYEKAIKTMEKLLKNKQKQFIIFSDSEEYVKHHPTFNKYHIMNYPDVFSLILMSFCHHFILANSTYSWWGAYLSRNTKNKIVLRPDNYYHTVHPDFSISSMYPPSWKPIISSDITMVILYFSDQKHNPSILNLCKIMSPMVIFTKHGMMDYFLNLRKNYLFGTDVQIMEKYGSHTWIECLDRTSQENKFDTTFFMYVNPELFQFIYHENYSTFPPKVFQTYMKNDKIFLYSVHQKIADDFVGGTSKAIHHLKEHFKTDMDALFQSHPDLFHIVHSHKMTLNNMIPSIAIIWNHLPATNKITTLQNKSYYCMIYFLIFTLLLFILILLLLIKHPVK